jgi:hypothetical protein
VNGWLAIAQVEARDREECARSTNLTVLSVLAVARVLPSGLNSTPSTASVWPVRGVPMARWVVTSHNLTVPSKPKVARVLPSGPNATLIFPP